MSTQYSNAVRWGTLALLLAGVLAVAGTVLHGEIPDASRNGQAFIQSAASGGFATGWILVMLSQIAAILGFAALYGAVSQARGSALALPGMALCTIGTGLFLSLTGFMAFAAPAAARLYLQGDSKMLDVLVAGFFGGPVLSILYPSGLLGTIGGIVLAVAIARAGAFPKWAAVLFALYFPLVAFGPAISIVFDLLGNLCLLASGAWIAASAWQGARSGARVGNAMHA